MPRKVEEGIVYFSFVFLYGNIFYIKSLNLYLQLPKFSQIVVGMIRQYDMNTLFGGSGSCFLRSSSCLACRLKLKIRNNQVK